MKKILGEFKTFITRGNVVDMAVGVIVGGAFTAIVNGLSNFVFKPIINAIIYHIFKFFNPETATDPLKGIYWMLVENYQKNAEGDFIFDEAGIKNDAVVFCDEPTKAAKKDDLVLLELAVKKSELDLAEQIIIYAWNRRYPATAKLDMGYIEANFKLKDEYEFVGNSHEKITRRTYKRK